MLTTRKVGLRRLLQLAKRLETVPPCKFNMRMWIQQPSDDKDYYGHDALPSSCHTSGCAMGWACCIPAFRRLGLRLSSERKNTHNDVFPNVPYYKGALGEYAAAKLFRITVDEAIALFADRRTFSFTPKEEAAYIRKFVGANGIPYDWLRYLDHAR